MIAILKISKISKLDAVLFLPALQDPYSKIPGG